MLLLLAVVMVVGFCWNSFLNSIAGERREIETRNGKSLVDILAYASKSNTIGNTRKCDKQKTCLVGVPLFLESCFCAVGIQFVFPPNVTQECRPCWEGSN